MPSLVGVAVVGAVSPVGEAPSKCSKSVDFHFPSCTCWIAARVSATACRSRDVTCALAMRIGSISLACNWCFVGASDMGARCRVSAKAAGCRVIDLSATVAVEQQPCLVPEVNGGRVEAISDCRCFSSPLPESVALAIALAPIQQQLDLQRVTVTACLPVSSRGSAGVKELARQTSELLNARPLEPRVFGRQMAFNMLARVEELDGAGHADQSDVWQQSFGSCWAFRNCRLPQPSSVPVSLASLVVSLLGGAEADMQSLTAALDAAPGIELVEAGDYPTAVEDAVGRTSFMSAGSAKAPATRVKSICGLCLITCEKARH